MLSDFTLIDLSYSFFIPIISFQCLCYFEFKYFLFNPLFNILLLSQIFYFLYPCCLKNLLLGAYYTHAKEVLYTFFITKSRAYLINFFIIKVHINISFVFLKKFHDFEFYCWFCWMNFLNFLQIEFFVFLKNLEPF